VKGNTQVVPLALWWIACVYVLLQGFEPPLERYVPQWSKAEAECMSQSC